MPRQVDETHACRKFACRFQACLKNVSVHRQLVLFVLNGHHLRQQMSGCRTWLSVLLMFTAHICVSDWHISRHQVVLADAQKTWDCSNHISAWITQVGFQNMHQCAREVRDLKECCRKYNQVQLQHSEDALQCSLHMCVFSVRSPWPLLQHAFPF